MKSKEVCHRRIRKDTKSAHRCKLGKLRCLSCEKAQTLEPHEEKKSNLKSYSKANCLLTNSKIDDGWGMQKMCPREEVERMTGNFPFSSKLYIIKRSKMMSKNIDNQVNYLNEPTSKHIQSYLHKVDFSTRHEFP